MPETDGWEAATWEGARRAQLRRALERTVRERLEALESLADTSLRLMEIGLAARGRPSSPVKRPPTYASPKALSDRRDRQVDRESPTER